MKNRHRTTACIAALLLMSICFSANAQKGKTKKSAGGSASKAVAQTFVYPAPKGIYVFCGMAIASKAHPAMDTIGYRIERKSGIGPWTNIAETAMLDDYPAFAARVGDSALARIAKVMKAPSAKAVWDSILAKPSLTRVPFISSLPAMLALGNLYLDSDVKTGVKYQYRVSTLLRSGAASSARESQVTEFGQKWGIGVMNVLRTETTDSSANIEWWIREVRPWPHRFNIYRRLTGQENYTLLAKAAGLSKRHDSLVCAIYDRNLLRNQQYDYYIVPEDFVENLGPSSQIANVFTVNDRRLPLPQHIKSRRDPQGVRLSWSTMGLDYVMATRIYRSMHFDSGYVRIAEVPSTDTTYLDEGVRGMIRYYYRLTNLTFDNRESQKSATVFGYWVSTIQPSTPQNLRAKPVKNGIELTWEPSGGEDIAGYHVYRSGALSDTAGILINRLLEGTRYLDTSNALNAYTEYRYTVAALSTSQLQSARSNVAIARPIIATIPKPPRRLFAKAKDAMIYLSWDDPREYEDAVVGYVIYRGERGSAETQMKPLYKASFDPDRTSYIDSTAVPGKEYVYAVASVDIIGNEGTQSAGVMAKIAISLPPAPALPHASSVEKGVLIEWDEVDDPAIISWTVYRNERGKKPEKLTTLPVQTRTYMDQKTKSGVVYYYSIAALDRNGREGKKSDAAYIIP